MHSKTRKPHKTPEHSHKNPTDKKDEDRQQFFFDESNAEPGPNEGKIMLTAIGAATLIITIVTLGVTLLSNQSTTGT